MEVKPGYKQTEVGVIPEEWEVSTLGNKLREPIRSGYSPVCPSEPTGMWMLSLAAVSFSGYVPSGVKPAPLDDPKIPQNLLVEGDIIISRSNTPDRVGLAGMYNGIPKPCAYPDLLMRVRVSNSLNPSFLLYNLLSASGRRYFSDCARGSSGSMVKIDRAIANSFPVVLPPLPEQRAIATALSDVDTLIASLDRLITKKRDMKQAAMQELLTGKRRLPRFSGVWGEEYIENFAEITTGSKNTQDRVDDGEFPFFVRSQTVERINSYSFDGEAVLTAGDGVGTGKVFHYINGKFDAHQRVYRISNFSEQVDGYFFYLSFSSNFYNRIMQMTAKSSVDSVRREMIARMPINLPPTCEEQTAIATILSDMDTEIAALEQKRDKTRLLKQGMMQELLTGRIRLV